jgi:calmodulin
MYPLLMPSDEPSSIDQYMLQELREAFNQFDRDGNGVIDRKEFAALLDALDSGMSNQDVEIGFSEVDRDGNGTIEFGEFLSWWRDL